jgi:hypothetical protein
MKTLPLSILPMLAAVAFPQAPSEPTPQARGLVKATDAAAPGYTLIAPLRSTSTYLIDRAGAVAHEWKSDLPPGQWVYLMDDGSVLRAERAESRVFHGGGQGGRVRRIAWHGEIVWEYLCADEAKLQHHDVEPMPNGHVLVIAWERKTKDEAIAAGRDPTALASGEMWPDMVLEIEPTPPSGGNVVWEWHAWDHLVQDLDASKANHGDPAARPERIDLNADRRGAAARAESPEEIEQLKKLGYVGEEPRPRGPGGDRGGDWTHVNSIAYSAELDLIALSTPNLNEIWFIDHSTTAEQAQGSSGGRWGRGGDLVFRWGNPRAIRRIGEQTLFAQHDAHWIARGLPGAGNVLVFNNGGRGGRERSSVDEIRIAFEPEKLAGAFAAGAAPVAEVVWTYTSDEIRSGHISGAQRLPNGNTLICNGEAGRVIEVTPAGVVAWDFLNPLGGDVAPPEGRGPGGPPRGGPSPGGPMRFRGGPGDPHALFRAWRYAPDHPGLAALRPAAAAPGDGAPDKGN